MNENTTFDMNRIADATVREAKHEMSLFVKANDAAIRQLESAFSPEYDLWHYRVGHNYTEIDGNMIETSRLGKPGLLQILQDVFDNGKDNTDTLTSMTPPLLLNDLIVRTRTKHHGRKAEVFFDTYYYDEERELLYYSKYERMPAWTEETGKGSLAYAGGTNRKIIHPEEIALVHSAIIPAAMVVPILTVAIKDEWGTADFDDFPILVKWNEDEPYMLYKKFVRKHNAEDGERGILKDIMEGSYGFQRYLVKVCEDREKIAIEPVKARDADTDRKHDAKSEPTGKLKKNTRSVIRLDDSFVLYTKDTKSTAQFKERRKCDYRYSVRGHFRQYKNGKKVWINSYDKNRNKPFLSHNYDGGLKSNL